MEHTEVFATEEETKECQELANTAKSTPMIATSTEAAMRGEDAATLAWKNAQEKVHEFALKHGLPEIEGYYGLTEKGEFVTV